jgi:hypothetical protein
MNLGYLVIRFHILGKPIAQGTSYSLAEVCFQSKVSSMFFFYFMSFNLYMKLIKKTRAKENELAAVKCNLQRM